MAAGLMLALVTVAVSPSTAQETADIPGEIVQHLPFVDIPDELPRGPVVEILGSLGILAGTQCGNGRFCPSDPIDRWVIAVWLVRTVDGEDEPPEPIGRFADVPAEVWWSGYVERLAELGITSGCGPAHFCPYGHVTRAAMASFLTRAFDLPPAPEAGFVDTERTVHAPNIDSVVASGLVSACSQDPLLFCPDQPVTRAEMAGFLARAIGLAPPAAYEEVAAEHGIRHLISQYTTYHDCCGPRVTNLQLFSDTVTGTVVRAGGRLSLNQLVGRRTTAKGYLPADTWVVDRMSDTVGGGISQYAATLYNAIFWGGFIGSSYRPHSVYISRYPPGIEGTLDYPHIDLVFRNRTGSPVLVVSDYTHTSLTVSLYGDNDGRAVSGEWKDGSHALEILNEGGVQARIVTGHVSDPYNLVDPPPTRYISNPELGVGESVVLQQAQKGWTVRVSRKVTENGRDTEESWPVRYKPVRGIIEAHPCVIYGNCPPEVISDDVTSNKDLDFPR